MYLPKLFKSESFELLKEIIEQHGFASLVTYKGRIASTKAMMQLHEVSAEEFYVETHIGRANPIARTLAEGDEVLCDFLGVHTYISSSWYDHLNVSTWNYEQVQIYGTVALMTVEELYLHLKNLTDFYELPQQCPVTVEKMGRPFVEHEMKGALGIKIMPTEVKIKQKLSQNRDETNFQRIIQQLQNSDNEADTLMAEKMKRLRP